MKKQRSVIRIAIFGLAGIVLIALVVLLSNDPALDVDISFNPSSPTSNVWVQFKASEAAEYDRSNLAFYWDFGDGTDETGATAYHRFAREGTYLVQLTAMNERGLSETVAKYLIVDPSSLNTPVAVFTAAPNPVVEGEIVTLQAFSYCRPECSIIEYAWDFGDGTRRLGAAQRYAFEVAGTYVVSLTITDISGSTDSDVKEITVLSAMN